MSADDAEPQGALNALLATLDLEPLEDNLFRGARGNEGWQRVYGGQVLGQALMAAARTVDPSRPVHSLHGYFLLAGDPSRPIIYDVERIRDGGSFTTRRVKAIQHGRANLLDELLVPQGGGGLRPSIADARRATP